ncbi:MAG TPA: hypothetical protein VF079_11725 [Sphingomicrobium sp.]
MRTALAILCLTAVSACGGNYDDGRPERVAQDESGAVLTFGNIEGIGKTRFFTIPIVREGGGSDSFSGGRGNDERNRLIVDGTSGDSRRILPDDKFEIVNWIVPKTKATDATNYSPSDEADDPDAKPDVYAAVVKRPGKDKNDRATYDVLLGHFESGEQLWVARGLAGVQGVWLTPDHKLAMVLAADNRGLYRIYDPASFQQLLEKDLPL